MKKTLTLILLLTPIIVNAHGEIPEAEGCHKGISGDIKHCH